MDASIWLWAGVIGFIVIMLLIDLFIFQREAHEVSMSEAIKWSCFWVFCGLTFGGIIFLIGGSKPAGEYMAGYLIEKSLSIDNIFIFALILSYFAVPLKYQHRVLFFGVLGALVLRAIFIVLGSAILENFAWAIYLFGALLVVTGLKLAVQKETEVHPERNLILRLVRRISPMTPDYRGEAFVVKEAGKWIATPLLAVLIVIETTDVVFAIDSIPAIFAITQDTFIVFTSNAFAILGLRALYFVFAGAMGRFVYLKIGLAVILVFVGIKMLISDLYHIPIGLSLGFIATALTVSIVASLRATREVK
ncbi:MAG: TerC family protein [Acidimicrobiia bacterium]|jgi:tellurite resistance protein TerC|nr:TerC family protein [Acidimicrobiia bacterium]